MWFPPAFGIDIPPFGGHIIALYCVIVAYAIVRYQFLDIQVVIRRSLIYSLLVTLLTIGYFGLVYGIEHLFQTTFGYHSIWISLGAFSLMALLFQPLKFWIQRLVDWIIFRAPQEEIARRMERLEERALQTEKLKAVSTMAAGMAHEIKNPLTALKTFGEFLPERNQDPKFLKNLHEVLISETQRIQNIVQDVLDFAKPRAPQLKPIGLEPLITSTVDFLSNELATRNIKWTIDCQHNGAVVQADADQIRQVLINLIQNAADAMSSPQTVRPELVSARKKDGSANSCGGEGERSMLTISTHVNNGHLELLISDTGHGIPKELLPKIFDPFVTTKSDGNGLGLAMVYSIIQSHHGSIHVESTPGQGTTFTVRLPV